MSTSHVPNHPPPAMNYSKYTTSFSHVFPVPHNTIKAPTEANWNGTENRKHTCHMRDRTQHGIMISSRPRWLAVVYMVGGVLWHGCCAYMFWWGVRDLILWRRECIGFGHCVTSYQVPRFVQWKQEGNLLERNEMEKDQGGRLIWRFWTVYSVTRLILCRLYLNSL